MISYCPTTYFSSKKKKERQREERERERPSFSVAKIHLVD